MKKWIRIFLVSLSLLFTVSCKQESIGAVNGVLVVYSPSLSEFIDNGGLQELHLIVETVDPEEVFSFAYAETSEFEGMLKTRRSILLLLDPEEAYRIPNSLSDDDDDGIASGNDVWALDQQVFAVIVDPSSPELPTELPVVLENAYDDHMHDYIYESFVSTSMTSPARMDSLSALGFALDVPKSFSVRIWSPEDDFLQYQRQPDEESLLLFSIRVLSTDALFSDSNAVLAREAMARLFFFDASADSVDRSRVCIEQITQNGMPGWELTGVWRNPEYLNAGSFTTRVLDSGDEWYILDMEIYNPGQKKEPYLREGWIIMDTFFKE